MNAHPPKILLIGEFCWPWYEEACAASLEGLGCEVDRFSLVDNFFYRNNKTNLPVSHSIYHKIQNKLLAGPTVSKVNRQLIRVAKINKPTIVWLFNAHMIYPSTVKKIRDFLPDAVFCLYSNDNPFSEAADKFFWRHFIKSIPYFDLCFYYRHSNKKDYFQYGIKNTELLRSYFIPKEDFPLLQKDIPEKYKCDVVFAGHYEDDGRVEMLEAICENGYQLNLYGGNWDRALSKISKNSPLRKIYPIKPATGEDYRYAICGAKIALCFLSTLNKDTYTRRNFQIPAMKTVMLSQYTNDLSMLFSQNSEALFFRNKEEMLESIGIIVRDDSLRVSIENSGYNKVYFEKHDVTSRITLPQNL